MPSLRVWHGVRRAGLARAEPGADAGPAAPQALVARGLAPSTAIRAPATLRSILAFAVADGRKQQNAGAAVRRPTSGRARREGRALTLAELHSLAAACKGPYRDLVPVLALTGRRWGELAGLQVGDRVSVPGPGLRLTRAVLASGGGISWCPVVACSRSASYSGVAVAGGWR